MIKEKKEQLGASGRTLTLPFEDEGVVSLLEALREKRSLTTSNETFRVVDAEYNKYYDEVTFLLDYSEQPEEALAG